MTPVQRELRELKRAVANINVQMLEEWKRQDNADPDDVEETQKTTELSAKLERLKASIARLEKEDARDQAASE